MCLSACVHAADESGLAGRKLRVWRALKSRWGWLDGLSEVDQSWVNFGLFAAYQQVG